MKLLSNSFLVVVKKFAQYLYKPEHITYMTNLVLILEAAYLKKLFI